MLFVPRLLMPFVCRRSSIADRRRRPGDPFFLIPNKYSARKTLMVIYLATNKDYYYNRQNASPLPLSFAIEGIKTTNKEELMSHSKAFWPAGTDLSINHSRTYVLFHVLVRTHVGGLLTQVTSLSLLVDDILLLWRGLQLLVMLIRQSVSQSYSVPGGRQAGRQAGRDLECRNGRGTSTTRNYWIVKGESYFCSEFGVGVIIANSDDF